ncbi:MAG: Mrp/NBP35 family ATP-binding protein [Bacteroidetes bacterium]|nr:Mrp/NBP35 family ATP-binding protein [Bacteroidota bacterium]MCB9227231.1 Mrp/NBP35 family ATP-binding protein [Chitinophagales bacterium]
MQEITTEKILKALSTVQDPDLNKDLVSLNMVKDIKISETSVSFTVVLTTPACPLKEKIKQDCIEAVKAVYPSAVLDINMTSNITSARNTDINVLPSVKNIICVASGKGGVGKSTVTVNLALSLAKQGAKVGILDADIHGPSIPTMLGVGKQMPDVRNIKGKNYILPIEAKGIKVLSIGFLVDERQAVVWRGPMVTSALRQFVTDVIWGKLDYLVIDMPPGTGDVHLTMIQTVKVTGAVVVTTPQLVSLIDAKKALSMFTMPSVNVPILGVVENMSYFIPEDMPEKKYYIFGKGGGVKLADSYDVPFIGEIPLKERIREGGDLGKPAVTHDDSAVIAAFDTIAEKVAQQIAINNLTKKEEPIITEK